MDELDTLREQIVIDDSDALEALANLSTGITTTQEKIAGLQTIVNNFARSMGGDFDAAKLKVMELNAEIIKLSSVSKSGSGVTDSGGSFGFGVDPNLFQQLDGAFAHSEELLNRVSQSTNTSTTAYANNRTALEQLVQTQNTVAPAVQSSSVAVQQSIPIWQQYINNFSKMGSYQEQFNGAKAAIKDYSQTVGVSVEKATQAIVQAGNAQQKFGDESTKVIRAAGKAYASEVSGISAQLENLGKVFYHVWTAMLAFQVIQWVMQIGQAFKEAVKNGLEFINTMNTLVIAVRALQTAGMDISIKQVNQAIIDLKKEFPIFTEQDIVTNFRDILSKVRDMGLSFQDAVSIMEISMGRSIATGKTMGQSADSIIKSLVNITEQSKKNMLEMTGIGIDAAEVLAKANELGYESAKDGYQALSDQEKAYATLMVWVEKYQNNIADVDALMDTAPAKAQTMSSAWKDLWKNIGMVLVETQTLTNAVEFLTTVIFPALLVTVKLTVMGFVTMFSAMAFAISPFVGFLVGSFAAIQRGDWAHALKAGFDGASLAASGVYDQWKKTVDLLYGTTGKSFLGDNPIGTPSPSIGGSDSSNGISNADLEKKVSSQLIDIQNDFVSRSENIAIDYARKIQDIESKKAQALVDLSIQEAAKRLEIQTDYQNDLSDAATDYQRDLAELAVDGEIKRQNILIDEQNAIAEAQTKYRQDDLDAERKYQEDMKRMREDFMLDLEEALRERDASAIIRMIRRYELEKQQAEEQKNSDSTTRKDEYEQELLEIQNQTKLKLIALSKEMAERRAALQLSYQNELNDLYLNMQRKMAALALEMKARREAIQANYLQELADAALWQQRQNDDLAKSMADRLKAWADGLQAQYDLTDAQMKNIYALMYAYMGPGGALEGLYQYMTAYMTAYALAYNRAFGSVTSTVNAGEGIVGGGQNYPMAAGGTLFADKATNVTFGEAGPEVAMFIPLRGGMGASPSTFVNAEGGGGGSLKLEILLSDELETRIVQTSLNKVALSIDRMQRQA